MTPEARHAIFADYVRLLAPAHSASITSWWRTAARNKSRGGKANSLHLEGLAVDFVTDDPDEVTALIAHARRLGLDAVRETDHVHVELDYRHTNQET